MRKLAALLSMLTAVSALAADMWRWRDAEGVMHYSDRPVAGAERINVNTGPMNSEESVAPAASVSQPPAAATPPPPSYTRCEIQRPGNNEVFNSVDSVTVTVAMEPGLEDGYRLEVLLNGAVYPQWPSGMQTYTLQNLYRGSYTLRARIVDASGAPACVGPTINFHIRQPTINSPARRPAPAPHGG